MLAVLIGLAVGAGRASAESYPGYTLYSPENGSHTYLVDEDNVQAWHWTHSRPGGYSAYLLADGSVLRPSLSTNSNMNGGGAAGLVDRVDSSNQLVWRYAYSSNSVRTHHDLCPLENGNVLCIAWERKSPTQAVQAGLDHSAEMWPDHLIEVQPTGPTSGTIVWEWHAWDHLIQDHDPTKDNYGVVAEHPELLDINLDGGGGMGGGDWMHTNGIDYNPILDQIVISSHELDEIWVIDHSTTTAEARTHSGGLSGKGGDFLYRWGRPSNYRASGSHYFNVVHCSVWIPEDCPGAGHLMAFNNREGTGASIVAEIIPPHDGAYNYYWPGVGQPYGPTSPTWTYMASGFYSQHLGGCQRLPNGNTMIAESTSGYLFEVNSAGQIQWSYTPGGQIPRVLRYGMNYPGLAALGLTNDVADEDTARPLRIELRQNFPNPFQRSTTIGYRLAAGGDATLTLCDIQGRELARWIDRETGEVDRMRTVDANALANGVYLFRLISGGETQTIKMVIER